LEPLSNYCTCNNWGVRAGEGRSKQRPIDIKLRV
jgi:hypothetical protein